MNLDYIWREDKRSWSKYVVPAVKIARDYGYNFNWDTNPVNLKMSLCLCIRRVDRILEDSMIKAHMSESIENGFKRDLETLKGAVRYLNTWMEGERAMEVKDGSRCFG